MVSFLTTGRTFCPCLFLDTALATQRLEACEGLCLAESRFCLPPNIPTACSLGIVLGNREAALFQGDQTTRACSCSPLGMLLSAMSCCHSSWPPRFPTEPWVFHAPEVRRVVFQHSIQRNRSLRTPQRCETKSKSL